MLLHPGSTSRQEDYEIPHAGSFDDEDAYNEETDKYDVRKIRVPCPSCGRESAPLCSLWTEEIDGGWRWVGMDHREPYLTYKTVCSAKRGCGRPYTFTTFTPQ